MQAKIRIHLVLLRSRLACRCMQPSGRLPQTWISCSLPRTCLACPVSFALFTCRASRPFAQYTWMHQQPDVYAHVPSCLLA